MTKQKQQQVVVKKNEEAPEPMEIIAASIIEVANGFKKLNESRLNKRVIILLIKDITGLPMSEIEKVLNATQQLEKQFIKGK